MSYQVIARKWRPQTFSDLVGQQHVTETLGNAIKNDRVAHAYIFSGARGVGKTTAARILAKALNCVNGPTDNPCGECDSCKEIALGTSLDVIEIDAASNRGIDQVRELREMVRYAPASSRSKVVILDEAHMLTGEASNALLKTLEEPPDRVVFVMATTQPEDLVDTIRSRSQHFHFRALTFAEISSRLQEIARRENLQIESGALAVISRMAEGSLRDALSLLEQARAYCGDNISDKEVRELLGVVPEDSLDELVQAIAAGSADRALNLVHTFQKEGRNLQHFCREAIRHMRNLLIARVCGADSDLLAATPDQRPALARAAAQFTEEDLTRFFQILLQTDDDLRRKPDPRVHLEMGLLRLVNAARLAPLEELLSGIKGGGSSGNSSGTSGSRTPERAMSAAAPSRITSAASAAPAPSAISSAPTISAISSLSVRSSSAPSAAIAANAVPAFLPATVPTVAPAIVPVVAPSVVPSVVPSSAPAIIPASPLNFSPDSLSAASAKTAPVPAAAAAQPIAFPSATPARREPLDFVAEPKKSNGVSTISAAPKPNGALGIASSAPLAAKLAATPASPGVTSEAATPSGEISEEQIAEIKSTVQINQKFLGELLEQAHRWELSGNELRLYFSPDKKPFAEMLESRDSLEKVRNIAGKVLGRPLRVCAKLEAAAAASVSRSAAGTQELRAQFERDPMVRSILHRFGGKITEVKRRSEES